MKKILVALLVLALVAPAMAVTLSGSDLGGGKMRISYDVPSGEVLRGVALKLSTTVGTATIAGTADVTAIDSFFDVFIDYAFSVPAGFTVTPRVGHPLANPAAAGQLTAFPASTFSLSMGALDETGNQGGVTGTGVLCEIQYTLTADATIKIEADTLRGGAVVGDDVTQPTLPADVLLVGAPPACTVTMVSVTKAVNPGFVNTDVTSVTAVATSDQGHALQYSFDWGSGYGAYGAATQTNTYAFAAAGTETVSVKAKCTIDGAESAPMSIVLTRECLKFSATGYADWKGTTWNRPSCWCYKKQCNGDSDGVLSGPYRVGIPDLSKLLATLNKSNTVVQGVANGICADFDHVASGPYRVGSPDLTKMLTYLNKADVTVPLCTAANYNFNTN
jgi:hypothetical protein